MNETQKTRHFSTPGVIVIFLLIYFGELAVGAGIFYKFVVPRIQSYQESKLKDQISPNIVSSQTAVYNLLKENKLDEASKAARLMLESSKNNIDKAVSLMTTGEVFLAQQKYPEAKQNYIESLTYETKLPGSYIGLADIYLWEKDYQKALTNAQKAVNYAPERTDFYFELGLAYYYTNDKEKAIKNIEIALKGNPQNTHYKNTLEQIKNSSTQTGISNDNSAPQSTDIGYTKEDIDALVNALNQADSDYKNIQNFKGSSSYNQTKVNRIIEIIPLRKTLAQKLLDKMGKNLPLTQDDITTWNQYDALTSEQNTLVKGLYNQNGGF